MSTVNSYDSLYPNNITLHLSCNQTTTLKASENINKKMQNTDQPCIPWNATMESSFETTMVGVSTWTF